MKILAIDTSCDESCAAIVDTDRWRLLSDVVHSHVDSMRNYGGVVPEIASREHLKGLPLAVEQALSQAELKAESLDWITVTNRPGLIGALLVGVSFAKAFAYALGKPFSVMNHVEAHLFSPWLCSFEGKEPPSFPWLALVVSGGHSELFLVESMLNYRWIGGTLDDAAGEAFDKVGKLLGLPYPAGPVIDRWVEKEAGETHRTRFEFPRAKSKDYSFSFSGLKTAVSLQLKKMRDITEDDRLAVAASAQEAILDALVTKLRSTSGELGANQIIVTGGVACNSRLRNKLPEAYFPAPKHCTDNAAMVAGLSALYQRAGRLIPSAWSETAIPYLS